MDILQGIQEIPGQTAGEKFKHINLTAQGVAKKTIQEVKFPKQLQPLLDVEVAKLTGDTDVIVNALLSSESLLCQRALQIPDLFNSDDSPLLNWEYFYNQLLSQVSLTTRCKIIKKLETDLQNKNPKIADEFYLNIFKIYGKKQAAPLLLACSEELLLEQIQNEIHFSHRIVKKLFKKFPVLVIKSLDYFCSAKGKAINREGCSHFWSYYPNEESDCFCQANRSEHPIMSILIDDYFDVFASYCENKPDLSFTLGKRRIKLFLKKGKQLLIEKPFTFLRFLRLKVVSNKLTTDEFSTMLSNYFDQNMSEFYFGPIQDKLRFFPREKKALITLTAFKKAYGEDIYDHPDLVDSQLLTILPTEMRIKIAELKLEKDSNWKLHDLENSWRVYLALNMIFEDVEKEIAKRSNPKERMRLMELLILCCKVNETDGLLEVLKYFQVRLTKDAFCSHILIDLYFKFDSDQLKQEHLDLFIEIFQALEQREYGSFETLLSTCAGAGVRLKLLNKLDREEYLAYKLKLVIINRSYDFNDFLYFNDNLELQKCCLDTSVDLLMSSILPCDDFVKEYGVLQPLFGAINEYNDAAGKENSLPPKEKKSLPLILLDDYPKLLAFLESGTLDIHHHDFQTVHEYILRYEPELYKKLTPQYVEPFLFYKADIKLLKTDFSQVVFNWDSYIECLSNSYCSDRYSYEYEKKTYAKLFVKALRWYQDLPIKLTTYYLSQVKKGKFENLEFLGLLMKSKDFQELIQQWVPKTLTIELGDTESVKLAESFFKGTKNTSTPIPLTFFKQFLTGDYLRLCIPALEHTASRTPTPTVIDFVLTSLNDRVSVVRMLINLVSNFAPIEERFRIYKSILHSNTHSSIHGFVLLKTLKFMRTDSREDGLIFFTECIEKKLIEDESILKKLAQLDQISDEHLEMYVKRMMPIFEKVQIEGCPNLPRELMQKVLNQLQNSNKYSNVLSVEYQLELIREHILEEKFNDKLHIGKSFIFDVFLHSYDQKRIDVFLDMFRDYATAYVGKSIVDDNGYDDKIVYPANEFIRFVVNRFVSLVMEGHVSPLVLERLLEFFEGLISPYQDMKSYLFLIWAKMYVGLCDPKQFGIQFGQNLDDWIASYGLTYLYKLVGFVAQFLKNRVTEFDEEKECFCSFFKGLLEVKTANCYLTIAMLLQEIDESSEKDEIVEELEKTNLPSVLIYLYHDYDLNFDSD